jgi:hypothetical protein
MKESLKITIEEWAGDNDLDVNDDQITELADAIDVLDEMDSMPFFQQGESKSEEQKEIEVLQKQIGMLELFIASKGYSVSVNKSSLTESVTEPISNTHAATREIKHQF